MATINDQSTFNHDGTTVGDPLTVAGYDGKGIDLNGTDQYVTTPDSVNLEVTNLTIMAWAYSRGSNTLSDGQTIFAYHIGGGSPYGYQLKWMNDGQLLMQFQDGTSSQLTYSGVTMSSNSWTHVAGTLDGTTARLYINGFLVYEESQVVTPAFDATVSGVCGALSNDNGSTYQQFFYGILDEVYVYDNAKDGCFIRQYVNQTINSFDTRILNSCPEWWWQLDETSGTVADNLLSYDGDLTYSADASTFNSTPSQFGGRGNSKDFALGYVYSPETPFNPADWNTTFYDDPLGFTYNTLENQDTASPENVYSRYERVGDYGLATWGDKWRTIGFAGGTSSDLRRDSTHVSSRVLRRGSKGGKYVFRWRINSLSGTNGNSASCFLGYNDQMFLGSLTQDSGVALTIRGIGSIWQQSTQIDTLTFASGNRVFVWMDFDNQEFHISVNEGAIVGTYPHTYSGYHSVHAGRSGDNVSQISLDTDPDLTGVTTPTGTVAGDWTGWSDKADHETKHNVFAIPNNVSSWTALNGATISNVTTASGTSLVVTGGTATACTAYSDPIVAPVSGEYVFVIELDDTELFNRTDETKRVFAYLNDVQQAFDVNVDIGVADAYDSGYDCGVMTTRLTATAGDTLRIGVGRRYDNISTFRNAFIIGVK